MFFSMIFQFFFTPFRIKQIVMYLSNFSLFFVSYSITQKVLQLLFCS